MKKLKKHAAVKSIGGIVLLLLIFFAIVSIIGYKSFTDALLSQYSEGAFLTAETASNALGDIADRLEAYKQLDAGWIGRHQTVLEKLEKEKRTEYLEDPRKVLHELDDKKRNEYLGYLRINESDIDELHISAVMREYLTAWNQMDQLCNSSGATFIYVIQPDTSDYAHICFLFSTIKHDSHYTRYDFNFYRDTTNDEYRQKYRALYEMETSRELEIRDRGYIETDPHITAMIGLKGADGQVKAILCVQRQMNVLAEARHKYLSRILQALIILVLFVIAAQSVFLHKTLLQPLKQISDEATRFSEKGEKPEKKLHDTIRNRDEIGQLADSIDRMEEQIQHYVESITQITAEKERINTELTLANRIQADMLPHVFPPFPERKEFDLFASMDPAKEVGGDFYDFFLVDDDHLGIVIADVSGKGIPAALFMMASKILIQNNAMLGKNPAEILTDANEAICANNREEMFVTVWVGILEISTGRLTAANAGHEYPVLKRNGGNFELYKDKHGFVVGGMSGIRFKEYEIQMSPGDTLFLYTDGVPEATDEHKELFGLNRMVTALNNEKNSSPEGVLGGVSRAVDGFVKTAEQFDDLTMLCLTYNGPERTGGD